MTNRWTGRQLGVLRFLLGAFAAIVGILAAFGVGVGESGAVQGLTILGAVGLIVSVAPIRLIAPARPWAWIATLIIAWTLAATGCGFRAGFVAMFVVLLAFDPAWVPPRGSGVDGIFYDGACGLCHRFVALVIAEDRDAVFWFAPLGGTTFESMVPAHSRVTLPDSLVISTADGRLLTTAAAARHALVRLGGVWRVIGEVLGVLPHGLCEWGYRRVASVRRRLFARPESACPVLPAHLRERFRP